VLFTNFRGGFDKNQIELYSLETGKRHVLCKGGTCARYLSSGHLVYGRRETLYAVPFNIEQLKVTGSHVPVIPDVITSPAFWSASAQFAVSRDGSLAYIPLVTRSIELRPVWVDRQGQVEPLPAATPRNYNNVRISPDGAYAAFIIVDGDNSDIWIYDLIRHTLNPLTSVGASGNPIWTPDGRSVLFGSYRNGKPQLFKQSVAGSSQPELLITFEEFVGVLTSCSPDGKELLLAVSDPKYPKLDDDILVFSLDRQNGKPRSRSFIRRNNNQRHGVWSPDGRWIAYSSEESGSWEIYVEPYPGPGPKAMISTEGGYQPVWSRDGKELLYFSGHGTPRMIAVTIETEPEFRIVECKELFEAINYRNYDIAPDGRFLMIQESQESTPLGINVVLNWSEELKRLVPTEKNK